MQNAGLESCRTWSWHLRLTNCQPLGDDGRPGGGGGAVLDVPQPDGAVGPAGGQQRRVRGPAEGSDGGGVALELAEEAGGRQVPDADAPVLAGRGQQPAVGGEGQGQDPAAVPAEHPDLIGTRDGGKNNNSCGKVPSRHVRFSTITNDSRYRIGLRRSAAEVHRNIPFPIMQRKKNPYASDKGTSSEGKPKLCAIVPSQTELIRPLSRVLGYVPGRANAALPFHSSRVASSKCEIGLGAWGIRQQAMSG